MGLTICVGVAAQFREQGSDYMLEYTERQFELVNGLLESFGLPAHREPADLDAEQAVCFDMYGYVGLHYLRRVAAHLALGEGPPPPGDEEAARDPVLQDYYKLFDENFAQGEAAGMRFQHLIFHSDDRGYYVPVDFPEVLVADPSLGIEGDAVGSSHRLLEECLELAGALGLPDDLDSESDEVLEAAENQGGGGEGWRAYGVESYTCLVLIEACRASLATGAAVVFT
jgi:hypothetical protein